MINYINNDELNELIYSDHRDPHHFLGIHKLEEERYYINAFQPYAKAMEAVDLETQLVYKMEKVKDTGVFTVVVPKKINYRLRYTWQDQEQWENYDAYSFNQILTDFDLYLFNSGTHYNIYDKLGAHPLTIDGVEGVLFAVWAPNAKRVSVIGDFCGWDGRIFQMRALGNSGIFEIFIPSVSIDSRYKFEIKTKEGYLLEKIDPYGNFFEVRPNSASRVTDISQYEWQDGDWLVKRKQEEQLNKPIAIYEVHLGSWKRNDSENGFLTYQELAHDLVDYVKEMGYTHIELMPISEYPFDGSWGYQVTGYYAPTSRFGSPTDFMYFVDYCHKHGIGVIMDWVPAHFPKDAHGLIAFDGTALFEHQDKRLGEHPHWGTMIFNYDRKEVSLFLIANALFWMEKYHLDGLRVDAVASMLYLDYGKEDGEWIPNIYGERENLGAVEFLKHLNSIVYDKYPGVLMIAEESTAWAGVSRPTHCGGLGFGLKWNMGWMNDFLRYVQKEPIYKKYHHNDLTFGMVYAYTENFILVLSHDEVVHGKGSMIEKMPGDYWQKFATLRASYGFMYGHPGKKLLFMGGEFGQFEEWQEYKSLDWHLLDYEKHQQLQLYVKDLNHLYLNERAFWTNDFTSGSFEWINASDAELCLVTFLRKSETITDTLVFAVNFTPVPRLTHRMGVPYKGQYEEIFNSDDSQYGGSGVINKGVICSEEGEWDGRAQSIPLKVPPLGITVLKYRGQ
jgi:1,4-alpha-glucan branching enzyme